MPESNATDVLVVGAGAIGMAAALELAGRGLSVRVVERGKPGGESSWAGAGIIYPAFRDFADNAFERLRAESYAAWPSFVEALKEDVGFLRSGGIVLEPDDETLERVVSEHREAGAAVETVDVRAVEPNVEIGDYVARRLPQVCQVRNPWLVRALANRLETLGVRIESHVGVSRILETNGRVTGVELETGERRSAKNVLVTAGAWTPQLLESSIDIVPVRGQILLFKPKKPLASHVIDAGKHYLVPRGDGRILAGSTEERAGFDKSTTSAGFEELYTFATAVLPALQNADIEASWSGLRPGTPSGTPYLYEDDRLRGLWIAAGHFRLGLQLAPGTAKLLADWITGVPSFAEPSDFSPARDRSDYARLFTA